MKKETIVSDIKTAVVVGSAVLTMDSCQRPLSDTQIQNINHKTDSAVKVDANYRLADNFGSYSSQKLEICRKNNRELVKKYATRHIEKERIEAELRKFMLNSIKQETMALDIVSGDDSDEEYSDVCEKKTYINDIRRNQRWFNDLMLYLSGKYNDRQLLNSEFFKVIKDKNLRSDFERNTQQIEYLTGVIETTSKSKERIYNKYLQEYTESEKKSKHR